MQNEIKRLTLKDPPRISHALLVFLQSESNTKHVNVFTQIKSTVVSSRGISEQQTAKYDEFTDMHNKLMVKVE